MADISKISSGGQTYNIKDAEAREQTQDYLDLSNDLYDGRDLTEVFADEIANFDDAWAWIQDRINNANWTGLRNRDYIPMTLSGGSGGTYDMQINIDTYYNTCDSDYIVPHHIDFISRDCYSETVQWNTSNNNNGNADNSCPYMVSNVRDFLVNTLYGYLPANVKSHITSKRTYLEQRYSSSGTLTDSTARGWVSLGELWIPIGFEIFGYEAGGTTYHSSGQGVQYPVFKGGWKGKIKGAGPGGSRCTWWEATVRTGNSTYACGVGDAGGPGSNTCSTSFYVPICFRIAAE